MDKKIAREEKGYSLQKQVTEFSAVVGRQPGGTLVLVLEEGDDFCRLSFGDKEGYAMTKFLIIVHVPQEALPYRPLKKGAAAMR